MVPRHRLRTLETTEEVMARDYRKEYDTYQGTAQQKKNRAVRNAARAKMAKAGKAKKGDGKDVGHVVALQGRQQQDWPTHGQQVSQPILRPRR